MAKRDHGSRERVDHEPSLVIRVPCSESDGEGTRELHSVVKFRYQEHRFSKVSDEHNNDLSESRPRGASEQSLGDQSLYKARLYSLLKSLQRKDVHSFFAEPVDPEYAPGYLEVIKKPMDFSTMAQKISSDEYKDIQQFQSDFELMCQNAMLYNKKDTIFYKWGKKLLKVGGRIISRETLSAPPATLPYTQQEEPFHKYKNNKRKKISLKEEFKSEIDLRLALKASEETQKRLARADTTCICKVSKLGKEFCAFVPAETALVEPNPHESTPITDLPAKEKASRILTLLGPSYRGSGAEETPVRGSGIQEAQYEAATSVFGDFKGFAYAKSLTELTTEVSEACNNNQLKDSAASSLRLLTEGRYVPDNWQDTSVLHEIQNVGSCEAPPVSSMELRLLDGLRAEEHLAFLPPYKSIGAYMLPLVDQAVHVESRQQLLDETGMLLRSLEAIQMRRLRLNQTKANYLPREREIANEIVHRLQSLMKKARQPPKSS